VDDYDYAYVYVYVLSYETDLAVVSAFGASGARSAALGQPQ
jgi:hypothetical protein